MEKAPNSPPQLGLSDALLAVNDEPNNLDRIMKMLLDPEHIRHNTELTRQEITAFSIVSTFRKRHNLPVLDDFLSENMEYRVSHKRAGRREWVKILSKYATADENMMDSQSPWGRIFNRRRPR